MKRKQVLIAILVALSILLTVFVAILINFATSTIPSIVQPYLRFAWPLVGVGALVWVIVALALLRLQAVDEDPAWGANILYSHLPASAQQGHQYGRERLLTKVRTMWIDGWLEPSLHGVAPIALDLREQADAVIQPWRPVLQQPEEQAPRSIPVGTQIIRVYDEANGELLIFGEPGGGKTTLLLELAHDLLDRAQKNDTHPLPVVFKLSWWAEKRLPFGEWLVEALYGKYQVPFKLGKAWVEADQVLPLLDGLDEVALTYREECVVAINNYHREHGLVPIVVCSRYADYLQLPSRLQLQRAVVLQPLTAQQIDDYLSRAGQQLEAMREVLYEDTELRELATTPFMLSILAVAYYGKSVVDLTTGPLQMRRQHIFTIYVKRVLEQREGEARYTFQQTKHWLAWLAWQMARRSKTEFSVGGVRTDWLPGSRSRWVYHTATGFLYGLPIWLYIGASFGSIAGLVCGLLVGLVSTLLSRLATGEGYLDDVVDWSRQIVQNNVIVMLASLATMLVCGLVSGLFAGLTNGLFTGLLYGVVGLPFGMLFSFLPLRQTGGLVFEVLNAGMDARNRLTLHKRMWLSAGLGVLFGLIFGLALGLIPGALGKLTAPWFFIPFVVLNIGFGSWVLLLGLAGIQYVVLRLLLWLTRSTPLNYTHFLDYAAEHILLRKVSVYSFPQVSVGYSFIHRLLLDYFATLESIPTPKIAKAREAGAVRPTTSERSGGAPGGV